MNPDDGYFVEDVENLGYEGFSDDEIEVPDNTPEGTGTGSGTCGVSARKRMPIDVKFTAADEFYRAQFEADKRDTTVVVQNIRRIWAEYGYTNASTNLVRCYVALVRPVARLLESKLSMSFSALAKHAISEGLIIQYFVTVQAMAHFSHCSPSAYFADRHRAREKQIYVHGIDPINEEDFWVINYLLDDDRVTEATPRPGMLPNLLRDVQRAVTESMQRLLLGIHKSASEELPIDITMDDVVIPARSAAMAERGYIPTFNAKKAAKVGVSFDILTFGLIRVVIGIVVRDGVDRDKEVSRSDAIVTCFKEMLSNLSLAADTVRICVDRGYEKEAYLLAQLGFWILATSQKGSVMRKSSPFTHDPPRGKLSAKLEGLVEVLKYDKHLLGPEAKWCENTVGRVKFFHLALLSRSGKPPVYMKTNIKTLAQKWIIVPKSKSVPRLLTQNSVQPGATSSGAAEALLVLSGSGAGAAGVHGVDGALTLADSEAISSRVAFDAACNSVTEQVVLASCVPLSISQKSPLWFLQRIAITSTIVPLIITWFHACWDSNLLGGKGKPRFSELRALVPVDPALEDTEEPESMEEPEPMVEQECIAADNHMDFLYKLSGRDPPRLPPAVAVALRLGASGPELIKAIKYYARPADVPKGKDETDLPLLRSKLAELMNAKRSERASNMDLAKTLTNRWSGTFKGNDSTRVGVRGEAWICEPFNLSTELEKATFNSWNGETLGYSPFCFVAHSIGETGCVAPSKDSLCLASLDGVFAAQPTNSAQAQVWGLEVKTKTSKVALSEAQQPDNRFFHLSLLSSDAELDAFRKYVVDSAYALQLMHHAASSGINRILLVFIDGTKEAERFSVVRFVAIQFSSDAMKSHRDTVDFISKGFLPFLHRPTTLRWGDFDPDTLNHVRELRNAAGRVGHKYQDSAVHPEMIHTYNNQKSGCDVLHRQMRELATANQGTVSKLAHGACEMVAVSARQVFKAVSVEPKLNECSSREQLVSRLNDVGSQYQCAMQTLLDFKRSDFGMAMPPDSQSSTRAAPATLAQRSNWRPEDPDFKARLLQLRNKPSQVLPAGYECHGLCDKVAAFAFSEELNGMRLNNTTDLVHGKKERKGAAGSKASRFRCDFCCEYCENGQDHEFRKGFKTSWVCQLCGLHLCNKPRKIWGGLTCEKMFHSCAELPQSHPFPLPSGTSVVPVGSEEATVRAVTMKTPEDSKVSRSYLRQSLAAGVEEEDENEVKIHLGKSKLKGRIVNFESASSTAQKRAKADVAKRAKRNVSKKRKQNGKLSARE